jgi:putative FmdB family regulatory protein
MPVYEYLCEPCQTRFERYVQRFGEEVECPSCHATRVEKQLSTFAMAGTSGGPGPSAGGGCCGGGCGCRHGH